MPRAAFRPLASLEAAPGAGCCSFVIGLAVVDLVLTSACAGCADFDLALFVVGFFLVGLVVFFVLFVRFFFVLFFLVRFSIFLVVEFVVFEIGLHAGALAADVAEVADVHQRPAGDAASSPPRRGTGSNRSRAAGRRAAR